MSLLWRLVFTSRCTSTHHKLALDALRFLRGPMADVWSNLFLANHEQYLIGSKAPDNDFKDFKNHVLHVEQGFWGGATLSARTWYQKTVTSLNQGNWPEAVYNAGVLSHYFTDPFQPFHTGQTEAEGKVHRAAEWSITKSYDELQAILEHDLGGYPQYELPERPDWLEEAIRAGATEAHHSYEICIDHYDLSRGVKHPPSGLDQEMKDRLARLIGLASVGFSRVLERAFEEAAVTPPDVAVSVHAFIATLKMPLNWIMKKITDVHERAVVEAIYLEVQERGKAIDSLPEDDKLVRKLHAQEVLRIPMRQLDAEPARLTGTQHGTGTPSRGLTVKAGTGMRFERTTVSAPQRLDQGQGQGKDGLFGLESCLMIPLASNSTIDHVADTALRALLSQAMTQRAMHHNSPEAQIAAKVLNRGPASANCQVQSDSGVSSGTKPAPQIVSNVATATHVSGTGDSGTGASSMMTGKPAALTTTPANQPAKTPSTESPRSIEERRLRKKQRQASAGYPEIAPPSMQLPAVSLNYVPVATGFDDAMFAPLPPMPQVRTEPPQIVSVVIEPQVPVSNSTQLPTSVSRTPGNSPARSTVSPPQSSPGAKPQPQSNTVPAMPSGQTTRTVPVTPAAQSRPGVSRTPEKKPAEVNPAFQKSYVAEEASSPIPSPHIRLEEGRSEVRDTEEEMREDDVQYRRSITNQSEPRIMVSRSGSQPVNRIANIIPARSQNAASSRNVVGSRTSQVSSDDVRTSFGTARQPTAGIPGATSANASVEVPKTLTPPATLQSGPGAMQSSLFASLSAPAAPRKTPMPRNEAAASKPSVTSTLPAPIASTLASRPSMLPAPQTPPVASVPKSNTTPIPVPLAAQRPTAAPATTQTVVPRSSTNPPLSPESNARTVENRPLAPNSSTPNLSNPALKTDHNVSQANRTSTSPASTVPAEPTAIAASRESPPVVAQSSTTEPVPQELAVSNSASESVQGETTRTTKAVRPPRERRFFLNPSSNLVEAPSIGPKSAQHFETIGVRTVFDLLKINPDQAVEKLGNPRITPAVLKDLQAQALLVCRVPELRGHDAQYLVACGVRTAEQLANSDPQTLLTQVQEFLGTSLGQRLLRGGKTPDLDEVTEWITSAREARSLRDE